MVEYLCDDPLSAVAAMIGGLASIATPRVEDVSRILVIEVTEPPGPRFRVWTGTISGPREKGETT